MPEGEPTPENEPEENLDPTGEFPFLDPKTEYNDLLRRRHRNDEEEKRFRRLREELFPEERKPKKPA